MDTKDRETSHENRELDPLPEALLDAVAGGINPQPLPPRAPRDV